MLSPPCWSQHLPLKLTTMSLTIFLHLTLWTFRLVLNFEPGGLNCTRVHFSPPQLLLIFMKMVQFKEYCPYFQMFPLPPSALLLLRMSVFLQFWPQSDIWHLYQGPQLWNPHPHYLIPKICHYTQIWATFCSFALIFAY